jgi:hypothetical protein
MDHGLFKGAIKKRFDWSRSRDLVALRSSAMRIRVLARSYSKVLNVVGRTEHCAASQDLGLRRM